MCFVNNQTNDAIKLLAIEMFRLLNVPVDGQLLE